MIQFSPTNLLKNIKRMQIELSKLENIFNKYLKERGLIKPRCSNCGVADLRVRMDKSYHCRSCGYDTKNIKEMKR